MTAEMYLAPAALGAFLLFSVRASAGFRSRAVGILSVLGVAFGLYFMFSTRSEESWRTAGFTGAVAVVGAAIACAWIVAGICDRGRGRWQTGVLVGVASSAAVLAAGNSWVVPALLFWAIASLALAGLAAGTPGRVAVWLTIFVSDAALVAGLAGHAVETQSWRIPEAIDGWPLVAVLAAAVVRVGALPKTGLWAALGSDGVPAVPLIAAGAFTIVTWALGDPVPWLGAVLVVAAIAIAIWGLVAGRLPASAVGAAPAALTLGAAVAEPSAAVAAGVAGVIGVALVALWPLRGGTSEGPRALHLGFVPPTIGFVAVATAAVASFERAVESDLIAERVVETAFSGLLPVALAVMVALGARVARAGLEWPETVAEESGPGTTEQLLPLASWGLLLASIAMTLVPPDALGLDSQPIGSGRARVVLAAAAVVGLGVAWLARSRPGAAETQRATVPEISFETIAPPTERRSGKVLGYVAVFLALGTAAVVGWFTIYGMRLGFL